MPAGGGLTESFDATFPGGSGAGFYTVFWDIDSGGCVDEIDENDNVPEQAENCYIFVPVSDGGTDFECTLMAYCPNMTGLNIKMMSLSLYSSLWSEVILDTGGASSGELFNYVTNTLTTGADGGINFGASFSGNVTIAFILVPAHVTALPGNMIPTGGAGQDGYEPNNDTTSAYRLSGSSNPFFGFVTCWIDRGIDSEDYFTFPVP